MVGIGIGSEVDLRLKVKANARVFLAKSVEMPFLERRLTYR